LVEHHHPASQEKEREVGVGEEEEGEEAVGWAEESNGRNPNHNARPSGCDGKDLIAAPQPTTATTTPTMRRNRKRNIFDSSSSDNNDDVQSDVEDHGETVISCETVPPTSPIPAPVRLARTNTTTITASPSEPHNKQQQADPSTIGLSSPGEYEQSPIIVNRKNQHGRQHQQHKGGGRSNIILSSSSDEDDGDDDVVVAPAPAPASASTSASEPCVIPVQPHRRPAGVASADAGAGNTVPPIGQRGLAQIVGTSSQRYQGLSSSSGSDSDSSNNGNGAEDDGQPGFGKAGGKRIGAAAAPTRRMSITSDPREASFYCSFCLTSAGVSLM
jgi:hypothetical protein